MHEEGGTVHDVQDWKYNQPPKAFFSRRDISKIVVSDRMALGLSYYIFKSYRTMGF